MILKNNQGEYIIHPDTDIRDLVREGIVPDWIRRDCEPHGMDRAEYLLCEYDWSWNWDLGHGYDAKQWAVLKKVRSVIEEAIKRFYANEELVRQDNLKRERQRLIREKTYEYTKRFTNIVKPFDIPFVIEFELINGKLPYFFLLYCKYIEGFNKLTNRQKARLALAGVVPEVPLGADEVHAMFPEFSVKAMKKWNKDFIKTGQFVEFVDDLHSQLPDPLPSPFDPFWSQLISNQRLSDWSPLSILHLLALLRPDLL